MMQEMHEKMSTRAYKLQTREHTEFGHSTVRTDHGGDHHSIPVLRLRPRPPTAVVRNAVVDTLTVDVSHRVEVPALVLRGYE